MISSVQTEITIQTPGRGLHRIDKAVNAAVRALVSSPKQTGLVHVHCLHTSASLLIQENADPTAKADLEEFFDRLAPENELWHRHTVEGPDDTVSHLRASVLPVSLTLPLSNGAIRLGTWQGLYLFEHRRSPHSRKLVITIV
ncbi:MAG: secondary thiamine-phosphate synthase enzyme YjbQ [Bdellovibrionota bacterium]